MGGDYISFVMRINPAVVSTGVGDHSIIVYRVRKGSHTREVLETGAPQQPAGAAVQPNAGVDVFVANVADEPAPRAIVVASSSDPW